MKLRELAISILILFTISTASAQLSPDLEDRLSERPNTTKVDVIILTNQNANERAKEAVRNSRGNISHDFNLIDGVAVTIPKVAADNLANKDFVREVQPDYDVKTRLSESTNTVGAEKVWNKNITGESVDVAVLDTGIEDDTVLNVETQVDYTGEGTDDLSGHGTHVAGIVASPDEQYRGVAYGADLFDVKVLDQEGTGSTSDVIAGLEYAVDNGAEVATLSLGAAVESCDGTSSLSEAVDNTVNQGVAVTVAAGNNGPDSETITAPGCAEKPITVGSSVKNEISDFSGRGPTADGRVKPDLVAPGQSITSLTNNDGDGPNFESLSGTSMATPHAAGAAALMLAANQSLSPEEIKNVQESTAEDIGFDENIQGSGRLEIQSAYQEVATKSTQENNTRNSAPVIEAARAEVNLLNESAEAKLIINATDTDNETLNTSFFLNGEKISEQEGYGEFNYTAKNLSLNTTYEWYSKVSDGLNTSKETQAFDTIREEREEKNETRNTTKPELPSQASDTARKARAGFFNPTSPFYGFDIAFDNAAVAVGLKSRQQVMEERAQEARAMVAAGNEKAAEKAVRNLRNSAGNSENATKQAQETLERVIQKEPEEAKQGLRKALEDVERERQERGQRGETNKSGQGETPSIGGSRETPSSEKRNPSENQRESPEQKQSREESETGSTPTNEGNREKQQNDQEIPEQRQNTENSKAKAEASVNAGTNAENGGAQAETRVESEAQPETQPGKNDAADTTEESSTPSRNSKPGDSRGSSDSDHSGGGPPSGITGRFFETVFG